MQDRHIVQRPWRSFSPQRAQRNLRREILEAVVFIIAIRSGLQLIAADDSPLGLTASVRALRFSLGMGGVMRSLREFQRYKFATVQECNRILIEHLDSRRVPFDAPYHSQRRMATRLLLGLGFLAARERGAYTKITEPGRKALGAILAAYADMLLLAHLARIDDQADAARRRARLGAEADAKCPVVAPDSVVPALIPPETGLERIEIAR